MKPHEHELKKNLEECNKELEKYVQSLILDNEDRDFSKKNYPNIFKVYEKYNGLCDLMCNYFTLINAGVQKKDKLIDNFKIIHANAEKFNYRKMDNLSKTHILSLVTFIELVKFFFFKKVPDSIFNKDETKILRTKDHGINQELLQKKLESLPKGSYVKFSAFYTDTKFKIPTSGHSMLICKLEKDRYMFYNPNSHFPSCEFYSSKELTKEVSNIAQSYPRVAFIDNVKFMKRVKNTLFEENNKITYIPGPSP